MSFNSGPVVIVVSEDGLKETVEEEVKENVDPAAEKKMNNTDSNRNIDDLMKGTEKYVCYTQTHSLLGKCNSYPCTERSVKDHLRVPNNFSNYETASSLYSSNSSMESRSMCGRSEIGLTSSEEFLELNTKSASVMDLKAHKHDEEKKVQYNKRKQLKAFRHVPLKRTVSAPLKTTSEQSRQEEQSMRRRNGASANRFQILSPRTWKKSLVKLQGQKFQNGGSRWSLRRTFNHSLRGSFYGKDNGLEISFPSRNKKKPRQKYRIVEARTGQKDGISFEVIGKQGTFLRVKGAMLIPDKDTTDSYFNKDCTFVPLPDMWFPTFFAFESVSKPSYFIRLTIHEELVLDKYDGTSDFKEESSFQLNRKPCATCLQVGVQTWARISTGEYCLGKVVSIDDQFIKVKFEDGKVEKYSKLETRQLVPDVVPNAEDITVGTRVIAQWLQRDTSLYPGVVSNIRGADSYDVLFDDGDTGREKSFQMRLMKTYSLSIDASEHTTCIQTEEKDNVKSSTEHVTVENEGEDSPPKPLWTFDNLLESPPLENLDTPVTPHDSGASLITPTPTNSAKNFTFSPWEIETFSQDSGYHGCDRGKYDIKKSRSRNPSFDPGEVSGCALAEESINLSKSLPLCPGCSSRKENLIKYPLNVSNKFKVPIITVSDCTVLVSANVKNEKSRPNFPFPSHDPPVAEQLIIKKPLSATKNVYRTPSPRFHPRSHKHHRKLVNSSSLPNVAQLHHPKHKQLKKTNSDPMELMERNEHKQLTTTNSDSKETMSDPMDIMKRKYRVKFNEKEEKCKKINITDRDAPIIVNIDINMDHSSQPLLASENLTTEDEKTSKSNGQSKKHKNVNKTTKRQHMDVIRERADSISQTSII